MQVLRLPAKRIQLNQLCQTVSLTFVHKYTVKVGLIFGGAYIRRGFSTERNLRFEIDWASLIVGSKFTVFALFYFVI